MFNLMQSKSNNSINLLQMLAYAGKATTNSSQTQLVCLFQLCSLNLGPAKAEHLSPMVVLAS